MRVAASAFRRTLVGFGLCALMSWASHAHDDVRAWVTTEDHALALAEHSVASTNGAAPLVPDDAVPIVIDSRERFQRILGFGAAITDASAWLIQYRMNDGQRHALLNDLFGPEPGIGLSFTRLTIGASDFSRSHYSLDEIPSRFADRRLQRFDLGPIRNDVLPVTRAALSVNPELKIMASPWSAPAWMKSTRSLIRGTLRRRHYDAFAHYLLRYVDEMAAEGVPIFALTVQNEPDFEPGDYPGMRLSAKQRARFLGHHLGPMLDARGGQPLIFEWDHNWDQPEQPLAVLANPRAARHIAAVGWHCYGGHVSAQSVVRDAHPDKDVYLTECSGGHWEPVISGGLTHVAQELIVGATRHWARGVLFWNLALDESHGPHTGGCGNCRGVVTIDSKTGTYAPTDDYYALAHASRFVRRDAERIASSPIQSGLHNVAFRNPDGSRALIVVNVETRAQSVAVQDGSFVFRDQVPARAIATFTWPQPTIVAP